MKNEKKIGVVIFGVISTLFIIQFYFINIDDKYAINAFEGRTIKQNEYLYKIIDIKLELDNSTEGMVYVMVNGIRKYTLSNNKPLLFEAMYGDIIEIDRMNLKDNSLVTISYSDNTSKAIFLCNRINFIDKVSGSLYEKA